MVEIAGDENPPCYCSALEVTSSAVEELALKAARACH
jgi:hypothetical protein